MGEKKKAQPRQSSRSSVLGLLPSILEEMGEGVVILGPEGQFEYVNKAAQDLIGVRILDLPKDKWSTYFGVYKLDRVTPWPVDELPAVRALRGEPVSGVEMCLKNEMFPKGRFLRMSAHPISIGGTRRGAMVLFRDSSPQRIRLENLIENEDRFRTVFEHSPIGIGLADREMRILRANPTLCAIGGYKEQELIGRCLSEFTHPEDVRCQEQVFQRLFRNEISSDRLESRYLTKSGGYVWANVAVCLVRGKEGKVRYALGIVEDITERKQREARLLEALSRERREIGRDLHDGLGQQLTVVSLLAEGLADRLKGMGLPEERDALRIVEQAGGANSQARDLARLLQPLGPDSNALTEALFQLATVTRTRAGVECAFRCEEAVDLKNSETATQLYRIAQEAVNNAVRHAQPSRIWIELGYIGDQIVLSIQDDGAGIGNGAPGGLGLGLEIMRSRAERIGGRLEITPGAGKGTVVSCVLEPRRTPAVTPDAEVRREIP